MVQAGDPLELRFKITVGTAQAGGTYPGPRSVTGARLRSRTSRNSFAPPRRRSADLSPADALRVAHRAMHAHAASPTLLFTTQALVRLDVAQRLSRVGEVDP